MRFHAAAILLGCGVFCNFANATRVTVHVANVSQNTGVVRAAVCRESEWVKHSCSYGGQAAARVGVTEVVIDVPPGIYGVLVHHDVNDDSIINRNLIGIPTEGVGFSRDPPIRFGFPDFAAARIDIDSDAMTVDVALVFEPPGVNKNASF